MATNSEYLFNIDYITWWQCYFTEMYYYLFF